MDKILLSPREVALALGIGKTTVYSLMNDGHLQNDKIGNSTKIPVTSVNEYLRPNGCLAGLPV